MEGTERVLVVDDDPTITDVLSRYLRRAGYVVDTASDGESALAAASDPPDLVVLDLMLPGVDGLEVCRRLRERVPVPVVMLTALGAEDDRVLGLEVGADDYVTKPFSPRELVLRVQAVLRRTKAPLAAPPPAGLIGDGDLVLNTAAHEATLAGNLLMLTSREYDLLTFLMRNPRRVFTRDQLLKEVWEWTFGDTSTVTVHVRRLRKKIGGTDGRSRIVTVWGVGYRYEPVGS